MIIYHGSNMEVATPFVHLGRNNLDFGKGFYVTTLQEQAKRWAETIVRLRPRGTAIINKYELDYEGIKNAGSKAWEGTKNLGKGAWNIVSSPFSLFGSDDDNKTAAPKLL